MSSHALEAGAAAYCEALGELRRLLQELEPVLTQAYDATAAVAKKQQQQQRQQQKQARDHHPTDRQQQQQQQQQNQQQPQQPWAVKQPIHSEDEEEEEQQQQEQQGREVEERCSLQKQGREKSQVQTLDVNCKNKKEENVLKPLDLAQLQLALAFAAVSLYHSYLRTQGQEVNTHPIACDLARVRAYMKKVAARVAEDRRGGGTGVVRSFSVNPAAAKRLLQFYAKRPPAKR